MNIKISYTLFFQVKEKKKKISGMISFKIKVANTTMK
ncbi:hypothetical protein UA3_02518 [Enterococcus faecium EnGen0263]|nr:hypothetical protein UA3_02518 [Enterococcus faecium EnGen0263]OTO22156.1 hypothetical protein A5816_002828 [Enterococcus sp. 3G1_DIV0629]